MNPDSRWKHPPKSQQLSFLMFQRRDHGTFKNATRNAVWVIWMRTIGGQSTKFHFLLPAYKLSKSTTNFWIASKVYKSTKWSSLKSFHQLSRQALATEQWWVKTGVKSSHIIKYWHTKVNKFWLYVHQPLPRLKCSRINLSAWIGYLSLMYFRRHFW